MFKLTAKLKRDFTNADVFGDEKAVLNPEFIRHSKGTVCEVILYGGENVDDGYAHVLINPDAVDDPSTFIDISLADLTQFEGIGGI